MANFIVDTYGQVLTIATGIDLTNQTGLSLEVRKPSGSTQSISTGVGVLGAASDGNLTYTVTQVADVWDEDGVYMVTPKATFGAGLHEGGLAATVTIRRENQYS
jgi:hypothetical protein